MQRQYVVQQPQTQPPPRQYIQSGNGVYEVPPNNDRRISYAAAPQQRASIFERPQPAPAPVTTKVVTTSNNDARVMNRIDTLVPASRFEVEGQMAVVLWS